jgi:hypothetical protein
MRPKLRLGFRATFKLYLRAKGVSPDDITKALAAVAQAGRYLIQQEEVTQPVL